MNSRSRLRGRIVKDLAHAIWHDRWRTLAAVALMVGAKLASVGMPLVLRQVIDELGRRPALALFPVFLVLAYAILRLLADTLNEARDVVFSIVTQRTVARFTERTFAHLHWLGARFHAGRETGSVVRDVQKGADGIGFLLGVALFTIVPTVVEIAAILAIMLSRYAGGFVTAILATFVCYALYTVIFTRRRAAFQRAVNQLEAQSDARLVDSLLNYDTVKYFATEHLEAGRLAAVLDRWVDARIANQRALTALHVGQSAIVACGIAAVMLLAAQHVAAGQMSVGDLVLVNAYIVQICLPLNTLGFVFRETSDANVNVERMFAILSAGGERGENIDEPGAPALALEGGEIRFEAVDFGYEPARQVLRQIDFRAYPGKTLAVVGGSGSGKSTLVKLLFRLYRPTRGRVLIDGQDIRHVTQRSLRQAIGIVPQDTVLFNDTIAYNIAYGSAEATRADVVRAARAAQLDDFIERLPDHYDTRVGERGVRLSGGERQRIAIARAILKNPRIVVFDEATSALDTRSERAIQTELTKLAEGRTSIVIAHRLSTVVDADWILVMEHGRIVEQGSHAELLARGEVYARMWALQWQQGELEHVQRRLAAEPVTVEALTTNTLRALGDLPEARRASLRVAVAEPGMQLTGDPIVLQALLADLCRQRLAAAGAGEPLELRVERHGNHAWFGVLGTETGVAAFSQTAGGALERAAAAANGSFTLAPLGGRPTYVVMLPLLAVADAPLATPAARQEAPAGAMPLDGLLIAVVDDEETARDALEAALTAAGARVGLAASGDEALHWLDALPDGRWPDALLCDLVLAGGENGAEVLERVREREARRTWAGGSRPMAAIALTGHGAAESVLETRTAQFQRHRTKPVPIDRLVADILELAVPTPLLSPPASSAPASSSSPSFSPSSGRSPPTA